MPGTISLMCGKKLLEIRTYNQNKEIRGIFQELHTTLKVAHIPTNKYWKNGKPKKSEPFHFIISTQEQPQ